MSLTLTERSERKGQGEINPRHQAQRGAVGFPFLSGDSYHYMAHIMDEYKIFKIFLLSICILEKYVLYF
jgi:hypothetical protein